MALRQSFSASIRFCRLAFLASALLTSSQKRSPRRLKSLPILPEHGFPLSNFLLSKNSDRNGICSACGFTALTIMSTDSECRSRQKPWNCEDSKTAYAWLIWWVVKRRPRPTPPTLACATSILSSSGSRVLFHVLYATDGIGLSYYVYGIRIAGYIYRRSYCADTLFVWTLDT